MIPAIIAWILLAAALTARSPFAVSVFFVAGAFGTLAMAPVEMIGGVTILPQPLAGLVLTAWVVRTCGVEAFVAPAVDLRQLGLFGLFVLYGVVSAIFLPRMFADSIDVMPYRHADDFLVPLGPTSANITQPLYLCVSLLVALAFSALFARPRYRSVVLKGMLWGAAALLGTGMADMTLTGGSALDSFRTASYSVLSDHQILDSRRVVGLMPEASAYGPACVGMAAALYFLRASFDRSTFLTIHVLIAGLLVFAVLSTSSTAYVGLAAFAAAAAINWLRKIAGGAMRREEANTDGAVLLCSALSLGCLFLFSPATLTEGLVYVNEIVLQKTASASFAGRSWANDVALELLGNTSGLGVGLGGHRPSGWVFAILSNMGLIGAVLMAAFLALLLLCRAPGEAELAMGLKLTIIVVLVMAMLTAGAPDIGAFCAALCGCLTGMSSRKALVTRRGDAPPLSRERLQKQQLP